MFEQTAMLKKTSQSIIWRYESVTYQCQFVARSIVQLFGISLLQDEVAWLSNPFTITTTVHLWRFD